MIDDTIKEVMMIKLMVKTQEESNANDDNVSRCFVSAGQYSAKLPWCSACECGAKPVWAARCSDRFLYTRQESGVGSFCAGAPYRMFTHDEFAAALTTFEGNTTAVAVLVFGIVVFGSCCPTRREDRACESATGSHDPGRLQGSCSIEA